MSMSSDTGEQMASEAYEIEAFQTSVIKRWASAAFALVASAASAGGPTETFVYGSGYRVKDRLSGRIVATLEPEMFENGDTWTQMHSDLNTMTAAAFANRWF